jgi:hypothetical protein
LNLHSKYSLATSICGERGHREGAMAYDLAFDELFPGYLRTFSHVQF